MSEANEPTKSGTPVDDPVKPPVSDATVNNRFNTPSIGRCVHYVLAKGPRRGEHRAATVTGINGPLAPKPNTVNLTIMLDQADDHAPEGKASEWIVRGHGVPADHVEKKPGTWHWPEIV